MDRIFRNPDFDDFEIRFGPGKSQKAYRFTVPENSGSGVMLEYYTYQDFVDVPFEVWNTSVEPHSKLQSHLGTIKIMEFLI